MNPILLFNTVKYLKLQQIVGQVKVRTQKKERFCDYGRAGVKHRNINLWIEGLDNDPVFMNRFKIQDLVEGNKLTLLNETRLAGQWQYEDASHLWNFNVHYLEYLVPLYSCWKSSGDKNYQDKINNILDDWYKKGSMEADSNQAYTISLRIVNQIIVADAVNDKEKLFDSIYAQYRYLLKHQETHLLGNHYLENLKAIVICSVLFYEDDVYKKYIDKLIRELEEQITEDGLHYELSLMYHKIVLEDLVRVAYVLKEAGKSEYSRIALFIDRMTTALYSLEHDINRTLLFNDGGDNVAKPTTALLNICNELFNTEPRFLESVSGYQRIDEDKISLIFDCGRLAPSYMPGHGQNDCLSFELFYEGKPVFVNSGTYQYQGEWRKHFRSTEAHNTVMINGHEQSELWGEHRAGRRIYDVRTQKKNDYITGSYRNYLGEKHTRRISLNDGAIELIDVTAGDGESYLHLAPGLTYSDKKIMGNGLTISVEVLNAEVNLQTCKYSDEFGKIEDIDCMVFSWQADNDEHGFIIKIEEQN